MNEQGHVLYAEISRVATPQDSDYTRALQRYLPFGEEMDLVLENPEVLMLLEAFISVEGA
ncbi:MAG: hypothetical protein AB9903_18010 [Vulcanimicrobiota bacterium]